MKERAAARAHRLARLMSPGRRYRSAIIAAELSRLLVETTPVAVLDAGCEDGIVATGIAQLHPDWLIVGLDLNLDALRYGSRWAVENSAPNVHFVRGDVTTLVRDDFFDAVIAVDCLTEVPDDGAALRAIAAALRPGGVLIVHTPVDGWEPVLSSSERFWPRAVRRGYKPDELATKLTSAGLVVDEMRPTFRSLGHLAQEIRDRFVKPRRLLWQVAAFPFLVGAVRLERAGVTWGPARELLVVAHRSNEAS